ncbi:TPA: phage tail fiber protein [Serratia marcescens]
MSVPNQTPYNIYTANGLTTVFPYEFYLLNAGDLSVSLNGSVITSGYTISGVGNVDGGEVLFLTPPANGVTVMLERMIPTYRLTDYQDNGDLLADTVNKDFDRLWMAIQQAFIYLGLALTRPLLGGPFNAKGYRIENLGEPVNSGDAATKRYVDNSKLEGNQYADNLFKRTLRVPEEQVTQLASPLVRKNKLLAFNESGQPIYVLPGSGSASDVMIQLAGPNGAGMIGIGETTVADVLEVHVKQFGAHEKTEPGYENFDSGPAFRAAIEYVKSRGGGVVTFRDGHYNVWSAGDTKYTLPFDDGKIAPGFIAMGGDDVIPSEPVIEMPVAIDVPSYCGLRGGNPATTSIDFGWDYNSGGIDTNQMIGVVFRTDGYPLTNNRLTGFVRGTELTQTTIRRAFIGFVTDGVLYSHSNWGDVNFRLCGIPGIWQGIDSIQFNGLFSVEVCYAGLVIGGMWLHRNNTTAGGEWVPPYVDGTDIYALGWADAFNIPKLTASYSDVYNDKHRAIDKFFDDYFFKEKNSKKTNNGGRLSNNVNGSSARPDLTPEKYRGICHRALSIFSRYLRGNCNLRITELKVWGCSRVPVLTTSVTGNDWFGRVEHAYSERTGFINPNAPYSPANDFYISAGDIYNADYSKLPAAVVEGAMGAVQMCLQGMPNTIGSVRRAPQNTPYQQIIYVRNLDELTPSAGVSLSNSVRAVSVYAAEGDVRGSEVERLAIGRYETQPISFYPGDSDATHLFKYRVVYGSNMQLRNDGVKVADVSFSVIYIGGRVRVFLRTTIPANAASLNGTMNINWLPETNLSANFGSQKMTVNVIEANIIGTQQQKVFDNGGNVIGYTNIGKEIKGAAMATGADTYLRLYTAASKGTELKISDFRPNTPLELVLEYNGTWRIFFTN